jgi:hypothetical protein
MADMKRRVRENPLTEPKTSFARENPALGLRNINQLAASFAEDDTYPVLNTLVRYLTARGEMPMIDAGNIVGARYRPATRETVVGGHEFFNNLAHELMHAADDTMYRQRQMYKTGPFSTMYDALDSPDPTARAINADWMRRHRNYRSSPSEMKGWALGAATERGEDRFNPPLHLNPTLATEQMLLLEAATRQAYKAQEDEVEAEARSRRPESPKTLMQKVFGR